MAPVRPAADLAGTLVRIVHHIAQHLTNLKGLIAAGRMLQEPCVAVPHEASTHNGLSWHALLLQGRFAEGLASCINSRLGPHGEHMASDVPDMAALPSVQEHQACCFAA